MNFSFFRRSSPPDDITVLLDGSLDDIQDDDFSMYESPVSAPPEAPTDPVRKAAFGRIGLITIDEQSQLPALLTDVTQSALMQRIKLPRNPRIATDELYELDSMDFLLMLSDTEKHFTRDMARWLRRLKHLRIPMMVLLPAAITDRHEKQRMTQFEQHVGVPVVAIGVDDIDEARQQFLSTTMDLMPAMGLAIAAHLPTFRKPLMRILLENSTTDSLSVADINNIQWQMVRQMCAAHRIHSTAFEEHRAALETMMKVITRYSNSLVKKLPVRDNNRSTRLKAAVATLLLGHATAVYLGAEPPSLRKQLVPQLWRLYRASRQSVST